MPKGLLEFCARVRARFGPRVAELRLFGSHARGQAHELSDVDVLVAVDGLTSAEGREIAGIAGDVLTEHGVLISPLTLGTERLEELRRRERLIAREIDRDGVPL